MIIGNKTLGSFAAKDLASNGVKASLVDGVRAKKDWEDSKGKTIKFDKIELKTDGDKGNVLSYNVKKEYFDVSLIIKNAPSIPN